MDSLTGIAHKRAFLDIFANIIILQFSPNVFSFSKIKEKIPLLRTSVVSAIAIAHMAYDCMSLCVCGVENETLLKTIIESLKGLLIQNDVVISRYCMCPLQPLASTVIGDWILFSDLNLKRYIVFCNRTSYCRSRKKTYDK